MKQYRWIVILVSLTVIFIIVYQSVLIDNKGIDFDDISFVFNDDLPLDEQSIDACILALESDNLDAQYLIVSKLIESVNFTGSRDKVIRSLKPLTAHTNENLRDHVVFVLSILENRYSDIASPYFLELESDDYIFSLPGMFPEYGAQNTVYRLKDGYLKRLTAFNIPHRYIHSLQLSPGNDFLLIETQSRKSSYLQVVDLENEGTSPEIIDTARIELAKANQISYRQRVDFENYSEILQISWLDSHLLHIKARLALDGRQTSDMTFDCEIYYDIESDEIDFADL